MVISLNTEEFCQERTLPVACSYSSVPEFWRTVSACALELTTICVHGPWYPVPWSDLREKISLPRSEGKQSPWLHPWPQTSKQPRARAWCGLGHSWGEVWGEGHMETKKAPTYLLTLRREGSCKNQSLVRYDWVSQTSTSSQKLQIVIAFLKSCFWPRHVYQKNKLELTQVGKRLI